MIFLHDLYGGPAHIKEVPIYGSTLSVGAAVMRGVTSGTNQGGAIVASGALTDIIGVTAEPLPGVNGNTVFNQTPSVQATGVILRHKVIVNPFAVYRIEYSQATADTFTGTMTSSGATITCASLEDLTGGFIYDITSGILRAVVGGSGLTTLSSQTPNILSTDYVLKIYPNFRKLVDLNSLATMFGGTGGSQAAAGSGVLTILETYISANGIPLRKMTQTVDDGLSLLGKNPRFFADVVFTKHVLTHQS